jgi:DNA-binding transcriptional ArsR family regulator
MTNADAMSALGDPTRRAIFERLARGPLSVGSIAADLPVSRPAVSQHLRVLKQAGLVSDRPIANRRLYSIDPRGVEGLRTYFDQFWNHALHTFKAVTENMEEETP